MPPLYGVVFHDPIRQPTKKPLHDLWRLTASYPGRQSRPHLFHVVRKVCTKSGHVSTIPPVVKNNSHHGISTIKSDYPNNALIFYHTYTIESKKKSVYFTDFSIKTSFSLEYRDRFERLLGLKRDLRFFDNRTTVVGAHDGFHQDLMRIIERPDDGCTVVDEP